MSIFYIGNRIVVHDSVHVLIILQNYGGVNYRGENFE